MREFLTLLKEGSWTAWGAVILGAGMGGVAKACEPGIDILGPAACESADQLLQGIGTVMTLVGFRKAPGVVA